MTPDEIRRSWDDDDTPRSVFPEPLAERLTRENKELRAEIERLRGEVAEAKAARERWRNEVDYAAAGERLQARRDTWADIAATLNDRAVMWEQEGRQTLAQECKGMANACRTYAEGVGVPSVDSLRQKRREAQARYDALVADLRELLRSTGPHGSWSPTAQVLHNEVTHVLGKHAGEQP
jgi:predicted RNase H-like nuclease (RuvC/YqgF family)